MRAIRNRYFARSLPGNVPQERVCARRAARTARSASAGLPLATRARVSSVAGLTVANVAPSVAGTTRPPMNRPYRCWSVTMSRDSGAGAYSHGIAWPSPSPQLEGAPDPRRTTAPAFGTPFGCGSAPSPARRPSIPTRDVADGVVPRADSVVGAASPGDSFGVVAVPPD